MPALAACGSDDDGGEGLVSRPEPAAPIEDQVSALNEAIANQDCDRYATLIFTLLREPPGDRLPDPGARPTAAECEDVDGPLGRLEGLEFTDSEEFGAGAISEARHPTSRPGFTAVEALWLLDWDGQYRFVFFGERDPQLGEEPAAGADPASSVEALIEAARTGDCADAERFIDSSFRANEKGGARGACEGVVGGQLFAPAVKETPDATPEEMGTSRDFAFYGIPTKDAYFGVILGTPRADVGEQPQPEFRVLEVVPVTEIELPAATK